MSVNKHNLNVGDECDSFRSLRKNGTDYEEIYHKFDEYELVDIIRCVIGLCDCDNSVESHIESEEDEPWKERFVLRHLNIEKDMRFTDISDNLGCHSETIKKYVNKYDVCPLDSEDRTSSPRVNNLQRIGAESGGDVEIK